MNKTIILLLIFLTVTLSSSLRSHEDVKSVKVSFDFLGDEKIDVKYGDLIIFKGRVSGSTGSFFILDQGNLDLTLSGNFDSLPEKGLIGGSSMRYYNIVADKTGNHKVTFLSGTNKKTYDVVVS